MGAADVQVLIEALIRQQLSEDQVALLQCFLANVEQPGQCLRLIEEAAGRPPCPHCACQRSHRCGQASGLQRYRCVMCRRSFNALTGTPLARLRLRDKWLHYLQCLIESIPVRSAARRVAVAKSTSFRWRHRFVAAILRAPRPQLFGIVD
ncbi:hypothetical protein OU994_20855 [Pseudoduganella sp. SL102]|uniref:IS1/IS1595 family N-terminal zinc-binding domain-containing protein n=1 Tax=Pseudoduganella sp. SL102 TaxID=2995154 RepID=UPI00248B56A6|nr:hypothetical protein [Pseudoduganella sp. SL102]WBS00749.1 hypothetical protein OU994_20855 [Pseudoduganella sp. SL102]